ncbi:MAG: nitronate monooxygenase, partial [Pseudomonadota bacterium]
MSAAGLPARAVLTPWLKRYLSQETERRAKADPEQAQCVRNLNCLSHCGFKSGNPAAGQFCIETRLAAAQQGDIEKGLFFRGSESLPFGKQIRTVREVLEFFLVDPFEPAPSEA